MSFKDKRLKKYKSNTNIYGKVPMKLILKIINEHGGVVL